MLLALVAAGCGGSDDEAATSDRKSTHAEAVKLLRAATAPGNRAARSGRVDGRVELDAEGCARVLRAVRAGVSGPYEYRQGAALPDYELEMGARDNGVGPDVAGRQVLGQPRIDRLQAARPSVRRRLVRLRPAVATV